MKITSPAFENEGVIPKKYTCDGENISPPLLFSDVPEGTKSLALVMYDPDVPKNIRSDGNWDHWVIYNIPPTTQEIKEESKPPGIVGLNTSNKSGSDESGGYDGPCPPDREHRYFFKLYALDTDVVTSSGDGTIVGIKLFWTREEVENRIKGHILAEAELMGRYNRN